MLTTLIASTLISLSGTVSSGFENNIGYGYDEVYFYNPSLYENDFNIQNRIYSVIEDVNIPAGQNLERITLPVSFNSEGNLFIRLNSTLSLYPYLDGTEDRPFMNFDIYSFHIGVNRNTTFIDVGNLSFLPLPENFYIAFDFYSTEIAPVDESNLMFTTEESPDFGSTNNGFYVLNQNGFQHLPDNGNLLFNLYTVPTNGAMMLLAMAGIIGLGNRRRA